jgi:hypothetical protein
MSLKNNLKQTTQDIKESKLSKKEVNYPQKYIVTLWHEGYSTSKIKEFVHEEFGLIMTENQIIRDIKISTTPLSEKITLKSTVKRKSKDKLMGIVEQIDSKSGQLWVNWTNGDVTLENFNNVRLVKEEEVQDAIFSDPTNPSGCWDSRKTGESTQDEKLNWTDSDEYIEENSDNLLSELSIKTENIKRNKVKGLEKKYVEIWLGENLIHPKILVIKEQKKGENTFWETEDGNIYNSKKYTLIERFIKESASVELSEKLFALDSLLRKLDPQKEFISPDQINQYNEDQLIDLIDQASEEFHNTLETLRLEGSITQSDSAQFEDEFNRITEVSDEQYQQGQEDGRYITAADLDEPEITDNSENGVDDLAMEAYVHEEVTTADMAAPSLPIFGQKKKNPYESAYDVNVDTEIDNDIIKAVQDLWDLGYEKSMIISKIQNEFGDSLKSSDLDLILGENTRKEFTEKRAINFIDKAIRFINEQNDYTIINLYKNKLQEARRKYGIHFNQFEDDQLFMMPIKDVVNLYYDLQEALNNKKKASIIGLNENKDKFSKTRYDVSKEEVEVLRSITEACGYKFIAVRGALKKSNRDDMIEFIVEKDAHKMFITYTDGEQLPFRVAGVNFFHLQEALRVTKAPDISEKKHNDSLNKTWNKKIKEGYIPKSENNSLNLPEEKENAYREARGKQILKNLFKDTGLDVAMLDR